MSAKDKLIEKLLRSAKKHKVLTYPVLALVAIISFFGNLFNWHNGAAKRIVAVIMVMVMFVSQSYFLTSSANSLVDTEEEALIQKELQEESIEQENEVLTEQEETSNKEELSKQQEASKQEITESVSTETTQQESSEVAETVNTESEEELLEDTPGVPAVEGEDLTTEASDVTEAEEDVDSKLNDETETETKEIQYIFYFSTKTPNSSGEYTRTILMSSTDTGKTIEVDKDATEVALSSERNAVLSYISGWESREPEYSIDGTTWYLDAGLTQPAGDLKHVPIEDGYAKVYCKRELAQYNVSIVHSKVYGYDAEYFSTAAEYTDGVTASAPFYLVKTTGNGEAKTGTLNLSGIRRRGYSLVAVEVESSSDSVTYDSSSATITFTGEVPSRKVTLVWQPDEYYLDYYDKDGNKIDIDWPVQFDDTTDRIWVGENDKIGSELGYVFSGNWKVGSAEAGTSVKGNTPVVMRGADTPNPYYKGKGSHISLYPEFEYAGIWLNNTDATTFTDNKMSYKSDATSGTFTASYKNTAAGNGKFRFLVENQGGRNDLSDYGIEFVSLDAANGFYFKPKDSNGPIKAGVAEVLVTVEDPNAKGDDQKSVTFTIQLQIAKCKIAAKASSNMTTWKTYDGNKNAPFTSTGSVKLPTSDNEVLVLCDASTAEYNSPNVREADKIVFMGSYTLVYADSTRNGNPADDYELSTVQDGHCYIAGEIRPITINVRPVVSLPESSTAYGIDYIRTGEDDPVYKFVFDESQTIPGTIPDSWLSDISYTTNRTDKNQEGTYKIDSYDIKTDLSVIESGNYKPLCDVNDINKAPFTVKQEAADGNYIITGTKKTEDNEWYYGSSISIKAIEGTVYDTVYISTSGKDGSYSELGSVTEEFSNNDNVWIYLYSKRTQAVTNRIKLGLKYDANAPVYKSYSFTQQGSEGEKLDFSTEHFEGYDGLYFPGIGGVMDFGTYTKSTIYIKVKYEDTMSGLKTLHYGLFGAEPNKIADFVKLDDTTGYATIEVLADAVPKIGTIKCYAEDIAGNVSMPVVTLSPNGDNGNYEWSVEQVAPKIDFFAVKYRVGKEEDNHYDTVYSGREWYNHCRAELQVSDATAGLRKINWYINEELVNTKEYSTKVTTSDTLTQEINSELYPSSDASYNVYAEILDNAGNITKTDSIQFKIDDIPPTLNVSYDDKVFEKDTVIPFKVKDEGGSGLDYVRVQDSDGNTIDCKLEKPSDDGWYESSFDATIKGEYTITAVDHAGNMDVWTKNIQMISNEVPACPKITIHPAEPDGESGWYRTVPSVTIQNVTETEDKTPVLTKYQMWLEGENPLNETTISGGEVTRTVPGVGVYNIKAWSVSASGVSCAASAEDATQIKVDNVAPDIDFTTSKGNGASILINFTVKDTDSGVNKDSIKVLHGSQEIVAELSESDGIYSGSFEITSTGNYSITASDYAGNAANEAAFTPMSMKVKAVTNISKSSATLGVNVFKGTFDIANVSIAYRKFSEEEFTEAQTMCVKDDRGNEAVSAVLDSLEESTDYVFKITAVSAAPSDSLEGEVLEYEGYFKTLSSSISGISVKGTARYATSRDGGITVGVFEGNVCIMATEVNAGDEFTFNNIPDGNYNIVATDGIYSKTVRLLVQDGVVVYPTKYIDLVLSGKNTSVVITTSDTPNVTADNMDSIFDDDPINYTVEDDELIEAGGTVEFKLYATLMNVSNVSADEIAAMYAVTDNKKVVGAYLDLSLYKVITDAEGKVERKRVTELARGANVSVTIPLGELAGKTGLEVVRIHDTGDRYVGASLQDADSNPSTYTITTSQFSTYAVLYDPNPQETPTEATTESTSNIIPGGTQTPDSNGSTQSGNITSEDDSKGNNTGKNNSKNDSKKKSGTSNTSVGTLRSSGSAKTGDATPVVVLGFIMIVSTAGFVILKRKKQ